MHLKHNPTTNAFEALDESGAVIPDSQLPPALLAALGRGGAQAPSGVPVGTGELVSGAVTGEIQLARHFPTRAGTVSSIA